MAASSPSPSKRGSSATQQPVFHAELDIKPVAQLAAPRGVVLVDELTGKTATLQHTVAGVTYYYSSRESCLLDHSVLAHVGHLLAEFESEKTAGGSQTERDIHKARARALAAVLASKTGELASQRIIARDYERAYPAGLRYLRLLQWLHGDSSIELVPAYLVLGQAALSIGGGREAAAEEFLSTSSYILATASKRGAAAAAAAAAGGGGTSSSSSSSGGDSVPPPSMHSQLHRTFGRLYLAQGNAAAAVEAFTKDVYYSSLIKGPEGPAVAPAYYCLGKAFAAQGRRDAAMACADKAVQVWYMTMTGRKSPVALAMEELKAAAAGAPSSSAGGEGEVSASSPPALPPPSPRIPSVDAAEALDMLDDIRRTREDHLGHEHVAVGEALYTWALVWEDHQAHRHSHNAAAASAAGAGGGERRSAEALAAAVAAADEEEDAEKGQEEEIGGAAALGSEFVTSALDRAIAIFRRDLGADSEMAKGAEAAKVRVGGKGGGQ